MPISPEVGRWVDKAFGASQPPPPLGFRVRLWLAWLAMTRPHLISVRFDAFLRDAGKEAK